MSVRSLRAWPVPWPTTGVAATSTATGVMIMHAEAESAGRKVMAVDRRNTCQRCHECGHTAKENWPAQETFHWQECCPTAHADRVGVLNVLRAGLVRRDANTACEKPRLSPVCARRQAQILVPHQPSPVTGSEPERAGQT
ncbi:zinc ribbon domain-containing protein [Streptomyces sp. NPDC093982]|uniref:zinc ribbon domain-containing protein n=1 Tax=Streptomyces sp. NPDC093982 TaxID=3155077 RepID=UPI00341A89A8